MHCQDKLSMNYLFVCYNIVAYYSHYTFIFVLIMFLFMAYLLIFVNLS